MSNSQSSSPRIEKDANDPSCIKISGEWTLATHSASSEALRNYQGPVRVLDGHAISRLDTLGVLQLMHYLSQHQLDMDAVACKPEHKALIDTICQYDKITSPPPSSSNSPLQWIAQFGMKVTEFFNATVGVVGFLGQAIVKSLSLLGNIRRLRLTATIHQMQQVGLEAIPLVLLLSYLVGAVIAFLGAKVLHDFGAEIYVVELVSTAFLREFAVLLTAIVLAGRTASAFTAQIGAMKAREEIDAIRTMGFDPFDLLVTPRLVALLIMLPLLTFASMIAGLAGGMTVGALKLHIDPKMYLTRMHDTMHLNHFLVGLSKAPIFAIIISLIGCMEGFKVDGTAQSVGERTTSAVVQAISLVIILDAFAALWFMQIGW